MKPQDEDRSRSVRRAPRQAKKHEAGVKLDNELTAAQLKELVAEFKAADQGAAPARTFPTDPMEQVWGAIGAVFGSWMNDRAIVYRRTYGIPHEWGTAVNVQAMVFGNLGDDCATGVAMTRDVCARHAGLQRRLPDQRPGRRRRRRHPHAASGSKKRSAKDMPAGLQGAGRDRQEAREALQGRAGHRVHDPARQGLDAADPQCQADRLRRRADRRRPGQRRADHQGRGPAAKRHSGRRSEPTAAADLRSRAARRPRSKDGRLLAKGINAGPGAATGKIVLPRLATPKRSGSRTTTCS